MVEGKKPPDTIAGVPMTLVKGGTTPTSYDQQVAASAVADTARRQHQDRQFEIGSRGLRGGEAASLKSMRLKDQGSPSLVLYYMNRDRTVRQECMGEITMVPLEDGGIEPMFTLVCPRCLERGVPSGHAQLMVRNSHRKFDLDERQKGEVVVVKNPETGEPIPVILAGTITCNDVIRCSNFNCTWAVRIDDSKVWEV